jgi:Fe-S cluster assembly iron-binding protein IscA
MLTVTETAGAYLAKLLAQAAKPEDMLVRLERGTTGNLTLRFDYALPDDTTVEHKDRAVLAVGPQIAPSLADNTLDVRDEEDGPQLIVRRSDHGA